MRVQFDFHTTSTSVFSLKYGKVFMHAHNREDIPHIHKECEIYINLSGDVQFMVEQNIYDIQPGDIVISRPYEFHHCVFPSDCMHEQFWMLISSNESDQFLECFYNRKMGQNNLIRLPEEQAQEIRQICFRMLAADTEEKGEALQREIYMLYIRMLFILNQYSGLFYPHNVAVQFPLVLSKLLDFISNHFYSIQSMKQLADHFGISVNYMERLFQKYMNVSPRVYLEELRLINVVKMLSAGYSVTSACFESGFPDCSHFIALFKRRYGITPGKFKKLGTVPYNYCSRKTYIYE